METTNRKAVLGALCCYTLWGILPVYWKLIKHVPAIEILCHRVLWSAVFLLLFLLLKGQWHDLWRLARNIRTAKYLFATSIIITSNWGTYIWAVNAGYVLESSLGYYINPLVSVLMGMIFLKERLRRGQILALLLAFMGVAYFTYSLGKPPWISLYLAVSFGTYGLLRKLLGAPSAMGLTIETSFITPLALGYICFQQFSGASDLVHIGWPTILLLFGAGPITAVPLALFAFSATHLRLATMGMLQFISPTFMFLCAVFYGEAFHLPQVIAFSCIWAAVAIYITENWLTEKRLSKKIVA